LRKRLSLKGEKFLVIHNLWSVGGYYHWIVESLIRLAEYKNSLDQLVLLLPERAKNFEFIESSLQAFDISRIYFYPNDRLLRLSRLSFAANPYKTGVYNPKSLKRLRKELLTYSEKYSSKDFNYKKIYVSRAKSRSRKIVNEVDFKQLVMEHNFHVIHFEDFGFWDQVKICSQAEVIISPHGAALTNMLFQEKQCTVIELLSEKVQSYMIFWSLASALELRYYYVVCPQSESTESFDKANLVAPLEEIRNVISTI